MAGNKRRGRPPKAPEEVKRAAFNTRLRTPLKERLEREAKKQGRSLSEEIEQRLERSLLDEDRCYEDFGGRAGYDLMRAVSISAKTVAEQLGSPFWWRAGPSPRLVAALMDRLLAAFEVGADELAEGSRRVRFTARVDPSGGEPAEIDMTLWG